MEFASDPIARALADGEEDGYKRGAKEERAAVLELVRGLQCSCIELRAAWRANPDDTQWRGQYEDETYLRPHTLGINLVKHDPRCPRAIALAIEARGKEER